MITYQTANSKTREKAIQLSIHTFKSNMGEQFTLLFSPKNQKHMFLALDGDKVVSMVNYYPSRITLDGTSFLATSIGSVCTDPSYRGQNIASRLLIEAEKQMIEEKVDFTIISGSGGIYERFGSLDVGLMAEYHLSLESCPNTTHFQIRDYEDMDFETVYALYQKEPRRYLRSKNEFKQLLKSQRVADEACDYPMVVLLEKEKIVGYFILNRYPKANDIWIKECSGNRAKLYQAFHLLLDHFNKTELRLAISPKDRLNRLIQIKPYKIITQEASIKIIHKSGFVSKLNAYLKKNNASCRVIYNGEYTLILGDETVHLDEINFTRLVFGHPKTVNQVPLKNKKIVGIPLPLPWSHNLNYQ